MTSFFLFCTKTVRVVHLTSFFHLKHFICGRNSQRVTRIGAALDGKISVRDDNGRVVWSFATGSPIYTSYQAPMNQDNTDKENASEPSSRFFIDCGDDWDLYAQGDLGRMVSLEC